MSFSCFFFFCYDLQRIFPSRRPDISSSYTSKMWTQRIENVNGSLWWHFMENDTQLMSDKLEHCAFYLSGILGTWSSRQSFE